MLSSYVYSDVEIESIELIKEIKVADSLKTLNRQLTEIQALYDKQHKSMMASSKFAETSREKMYFPGGGVNQYHKESFDKYVADMKKHAAVINDLCRAQNGDFENNDYYNMFRPFVSLKGKKNTEVVGKVYRVTEKYSFNHSQHKTETKTEYVLLNHDDSEVVYFLSDEEYDQDFVNPMESTTLQLKNFRVSDDGYIEEITNSSTSQDNDDNLHTVELIYKGGEFLGYCRVYFEDLKGENIYFMNPDLGEFVDESNSCNMESKFLNKKFRITYYIGNIKVHSEDGGDEIIEDKIVKSIVLIN